MINHGEVYLCNSYNPYRNLATETAMFDVAEKGKLSFFLWQNSRTVVIGRNQDANVEVDLPRLTAENGHLARRYTGGGAVFHDMGNLNYSFITAAEDYSADFFDSVLLSGFSKLGITAQKSGRNDLICNGRKFGGCAFRHTKAAGLYHGTVLVNEDISLLGRYLTPDRAKLLSKKVQSVESRVINLAEVNPSCSIESVKAALISALAAKLPLTYGDCRALNGVEEKEKELSSDAWLYGANSLPFGRVVRFDWGTAEVRYMADSGVIRKVKVYTDSLDEGMSARAEQMLLGCRLDSLPVTEDVALRDVFSIIRS